MRPALAIVLLAALTGPAAANHQAEKSNKASWNKLRYVGGTIAVKPSAYDWNTTLTITREPPSITVVIAPSTLFTARQTLHIAASQVVSISAGLAAWRRVADVSGAIMPARTPTLFGLLKTGSFLGIVFQTSGDKPASILLDTNLGPYILPVLKQVTGKPIEDSPQE